MLAGRSGQLRGEWVGHAIRLWHSGLPLYRRSAWGGVVPGTGAVRDGVVEVHQESTSGNRSSGQQRPPGVVPSTTVIVPCRKEIDHIQSFLADLERQVEQLPGLEIITTDGLSDVGTREVLAVWAKRLPTLRCSTVRSSVSRRTLTRLSWPPAVIASSAWTCIRGTLTAIL